MNGKLAVGLTEDDCKGMAAELKASGDPRHNPDRAFDFDAVPYLGGAPTHPDFKRKRK